MPRLGQAMGTRDWNATVRRLADQIAFEQRDAPLPQAIFPSAPASTSPSAPPEIVVFDDGEVGVQAARRLQHLGHRVNLARPTDELVDLVEGKRITSAAVNLALPNGWGTLRRLRSFQCTPDARIFGYAVAPGATEGLWLGVIDVFFLSMGESNAAEVVRRLAPAATRVIGIGATPSALEEVRLQLDGGRLKTATVVNAEQVQEIAPGLRPQVVLLHLAPHCFNAFNGIRALRALPELGDLPILFVLEPIAQPRDVAFFSAGLRSLAMGNQLPATELANRLSYNVKLNAHRQTTGERETGRPLS